MAKKKTKARRAKKPLRKVPKKSDASVLRTARAEYGKVSSALKSELEGRKEISQLIFNHYSSYGENMRSWMDIAAKVGALLQKVECLERAAENSVIAEKLRDAQLEVQELRRAIQNTRDRGQA
jgi:hypothetical protein